MKNKMLISILVVTCCFTSAWGQLRIVNSGRVVAENNMSIAPTTVSDTVPAVNVVSTALFTKSAYGVYSKTWYQKNPAGAGSGYNFGNRVLGLYGCTQDNLASSGQYTPTPPFNAGVAGVSDKGVGVYGATGSASFPLYNQGQYAGYFNGNTKVIGTLTCTSLTQTSDVRTKNNVQYLQSDAIKSISQLRPISYYYNHDVNLFTEDDSKGPAAQQMHYGFVAQELKEVLPDIVYMGQDSLYSINYIELIPLLVKTIQELSNQVQELQEQVNRNDKNMGK